MYFLHPTHLVCLRHCPPPPWLRYWSLDYTTVKPHDPTVISFDSISAWSGRRTRRSLSRKCTPRDWKVKTSPGGDFLPCFRWKQLTPPPLCSLYHALAIVSGAVWSGNPFHTCASTFPTHGTNSDCKSYYQWGAHWYKILLPVRLRLEPVIAVRWWGVGQGSGEGTVPPPQENYFYITVQWWWWGAGEGSGRCPSPTTLTPTPSTLAVPQSYFLSWHLFSGVLLCAYSFRPLVNVLQLKLRVVWR